MAMKVCLAATFFWTQRTAFQAFLAIRPGSWCVSALGQSRFARPRLQRVRCLSSHMHRRTRTSPAFSPGAGNIQVSSKCIVRKNGLSACFGLRQHGQHDVPAEMGPVLAVSAGLKPWVTGHTCAVLSDGRLVCFGDDRCNRCGQCDVPADLGRVWAGSQQAKSILVQCVQMAISSALEATHMGNVMCPQI